MKARKLNRSIECIAIARLARQQSEFCSELSKRGDAPWKLSGELNSHESFTIKCFPLISLITCARLVPRMIQTSGILFAAVVGLMLIFSYLTPNMLEIVEILQSHFCIIKATSQRDALRYISPYLV